LVGGGGSNGGGESLEDAFLLAGAQSVILPLWNSPQVISYFSLRFAAVITKQSINHQPTTRQPINPQASLPNSLLFMHFYASLPTATWTGETFPVAKALQVISMLLSLSMFLFANSS
jgi:hypothetical protein